MIVIERRNKIKEILLEERSVKVNELAALLTSRKRRSAGT